MNSPENAQPGGVLNDIGLYILGVDTRWIVVGAVLFLVVFSLVLKFVKKRGMSRDDAQSLGLALLQLYSAPVLFCLLVLTQPPAINQVGNFERQGAGLLAFIFLVTGVFGEIKKIWIHDPKIPDNKPAEHSEHK